MDGEQRGFPRLYAAASLKQLDYATDVGMSLERFPRLYAAASLKRNHVPTRQPRDRQFSAALCRGLIEAYSPSVADKVANGGFPRLYAAASLKHGHRCSGYGGVGGFPRLYAAASLKPELGRYAYRFGVQFSAALCRGLIEARTSDPYDLQQES